MIDIQVISRKEAKTAGLKYYFTGEPCPAGHISVRYTCVGTCKECGREKSRARHVHTTDKRRAYQDLGSFLAAARAEHADTYTYERAVYVNAHTPLCITCPKHGGFLQSPTNHMQGKGCPRCAAAAFGARSRSSLEAFLGKARAVWGDTWDYSQTEYLGARALLRILCRSHGEFLQTQSNHLDGKVGCTKCNHMKSRGEDEVFRLMSTFTPTEQRNRAVIAPKELDIYMPAHRLAIEYCGEFWHSHGDAADERANRRKHAQKYQDCKAQGVRLITLFETEWQQRNYAVRRLLRNAVGKSRGKLMARKCELRKVSDGEARAFFERYHPQGGRGHGEHYALLWGSKIVACMRFVFGVNDRGVGAGARVWTLARYATRITVAGAASRLFRAFLREHAPREVKSFSDNRFFEGGMYQQLGFVMEAEVAPDYQVWHPRTGLRPKAHYQRRMLPARIAELEMPLGFDAARDPRTEAEMTYLLRARRLYDCGKKRWVWTAKTAPCTPTPSVP